ncbi:1107_t:CDS:10, partial [Ambispora leptoticha]
NLTYTENEIDDFEVFNSFTDSRGTILIRLVRNNTQAMYEIPSPNKTYNETGVILSYEGEILSQFHIGEAFPINETLTMSLREDGGFLRTYIWPNYTVTWTRFSSLNDQYQPIKLGEGVFYIPQPQDIFVMYDVFIKVDGGYGCAILTNSSLPITSKEITWRAYVLFLPFNSNQTTDLFILYESSMPWYRMWIGPCRVSYDGTGYGCFLKPYVNETYLRFIYNIRFISEGSVTLINRLQFRDPSNWNFLDSYSVFAGGYIVVGIQSQTERVGDLYNTTGMVYDTIDFAKGHVHMNIYPMKNTFWLSSFSTNNTKEWTITTIDLPKLIQYGTFHERFPNPNINRTIPEINSTISLRYKSLTIMYYSQVNFGTGNVSIYQYPNTLRQVTSGGSAVYDPVTGLTNVTISVFSSTFNRPNTTYYIVVDTNFVMRLQNHEPLYGIDKNIWFLTTESKSQDLHTDTASGLLRLSVNGTSEFKAAYATLGYSVVNALANQIAEAIPVANSRISIRNAFQIEPNTQPPQLLLRMDIGQLTDDKEPDVPDLINDFRVLLKESQFTDLSQNNYTAWLDSTYNFVPTDDLWRRYKFAIILTVVLLVATSLVYLFAQRANKEARNFIIFTIVIIIQDFIFDLLFVIENSNDFPELFLPSIITLVIPLTFNTFIALFVILSENSREDKFNDWFRKYPQIAAVFTILSCADVEVLKILSSQVGRLNLFSATFSDRAESMIFWASCTNILIEDVPQFIIRFLYHGKNITYNILPTIALVSSAIGLLFAVINRLYQITARCSQRRCQKAVMQDDELEGIPVRNINGYQIVNRTVTLE